MECRDRVEGREAPRSRVHEGSDVDSDRLAKYELESGS